MIGIFAGKGISGTKADSAVKNSVQNEDTAIEIKPVNLPQKHGAKDDSIVISAFFNFIALENVSSSGHLLIILAFLRIVFINITVCYIVADLSKMNDTIRENELLKLKHEYSQQYISSANIEYEVIRKLRHDFKDNWSIVYDLIMNDKKEKALLFIKEYLDELSEKEVFVKTNNQNIWYKRCNAVKNSIKKSYYDCEAKRNLIASSFKQLNDRCRDSMFLQRHI